MLKVERAAQLELSDWSYLAVATIELLVARIRFSIVGAQRILRELRVPLPVSCRHRETPLAKIDVRRLSWAIAVAAKHVPWRSNCLIQVMAADRWLRRYHLGPNFYLGVARDEQGLLTGHAWIRFGDITVTGGRYEQFSTLIEPGAN
ncbi:MAG: lasso peptide biosynthesis B2 protein [Kiloniellales bacterium]|nr:lasso peptide biosynthesis B2 protein [Kiloniellales bacterium]